MKRILIASLALMASTHVTAGIETLRHGDGLWVHYDPTTIEHTPQYSRVWVYMNYEMPAKPKAGDRVNGSLKTLDEFDCKNMQWRIARLESYSRHGGHGKLLRKEDTPGPWQSIEILPGSPWQDIPTLGPKTALYKIMCKTQGNK